jgi:hypothetical protein
MHPTLWIDGASPTTCSTLFPYRGVGMVTYWCKTKNLAVRRLRYFGVALSNEGPNAQAYTRKVPSVVSMPVASEHRCARSRTASFQLSTICGGGSLEVIKYPLALLLSKKRSGVARTSHGSCSAPGCPSRVHRR